MPLEDGLTQEAGRKKRFTAHAVGPRLAQSATLSPCMIAWVAAPAAVCFVLTILSYFAAIVPHITSLFLDAQHLVAGLVLLTTGLILASGPPLNRDVKDGRGPDKKRHEKKYERCQQTLQDYNTQGQQPSRLRTSTTTSSDPAAVPKRYDAKDVNQRPHAGVPTQCLSSSSNNAVIMARLDAIQTVLAELTADRNDSASQQASKPAALAPKLACIAPKRPERQKQMQQAQPGQQQLVCAVGPVGVDENPEMVRTLPRAKQPKISQRSGAVAHYLCDPKHGADRLLSVRAIGNHSGNRSSSIKRLPVLLSIHATKSLEDSTRVPDVSAAAKSPVPHQVDKKPVRDVKIAEEGGHATTAGQDMTDANEGTRPRLAPVDDQQHLSYHEKCSIAEAVTRLDANRKQQALAIIRNDAPELIESREGSIVIAIKDMPDPVFMKLTNLLRTQPGYWPRLPPLPSVSAAVNGSVAASGLANRCAASTAATRLGIEQTAPSLSTAATRPDIDSKSLNLMPSLSLSDVCLHKLPWPREADEPCSKIPSPTHVSNGPRTKNEAIMECQRQLLEFEAQNIIRLNMVRRQHREREWISSPEQQQQNPGLGRSQYDPTRAAPAFATGEAGRGQSLRAPMREDEKKRDVALPEQENPEKEKRHWSRDALDDVSQQQNKISQRQDSLSQMLQRAGVEDENEDGFVMVEKDDDADDDDDDDEEEEEIGKEEKEQDKADGDTSCIRNRRPSRAECCLS